MEYSLFDSSQSENVTELFIEVFSASEGESEGRSIGSMVSCLIATTKPEDLIGCVASNNNHLMGCIFFSRLIVPSGQTAFILSPVAVSTPIQGSGVGQQLIRYGLNHLCSLGVDLVFTYGDPAFYSKIGFKQIGEHIVKAPLPLSQPEGWLAQSLDGTPIQTMAGSSQCVEALNDGKYW